MNFEASRDRPGNDPIKQGSESMDIKGFERDAEGSIKALVSNALSKGLSLEQTQAAVDSLLKRQFGIQKIFKRIESGEEYE